MDNIQITDTQEKHIAILFAANAADAAYLSSGAFAPEAIVATPDNLGELQDAVRRADRLFLYIDATRQTPMDLLVQLWHGELKEKRERTFVALRTDGTGKVADKMLGFNVGAGLYFFTLRRNSNTWVDSVDTPLAAVPLESVRRTAEETPVKGQTSLMRNLKFYYEREAQFDWRNPGTLHRGSNPPDDAPEVEARSVVVNVSVLYTLYAYPRCREHYISVEVKGSGYKMNIRTVDNGDNNHDGDDTDTGDYRNFVYPYWVHTGEAYTGNLIRKFTIECELAGPNGQIVERLPTNDVKTGEVSETKSCSLNFSVGEGGPGVGFSVGWSSTVTYPQSDFETNNSTKISENSQMVIWETVPCQWFHQPAFRDTDTRNELDVDVITYNSLAAGNGTVYRDLNSPDFPIGFHNMAPQASVLFYTTEGKAKVNTTCRVELQDSKQYWCAGVRHDAQHRWNYRGANGEISDTDTLEFEFNEEELIFD